MPNDAPIVLTREAHIAHIIQNFPRAGAKSLQFTATAPNHIWAMPAARDAGSGPNSEFDSRDGGHTHWSRECINRLDDLTDDILYDEQLRQVSAAMVEPQPRPIDWTIARDLAGALVLNFAGLAFGGLVLWECLRP